MTAEPLIAGNFYNKYESANIVARLLMRGFLRDFEQLLGSAQPHAILDIGCGEGHLTARLINLFPAARTSALDISAEVLQQAIDRCAPRCTFVGASALSLPFPDKEFDLVVCVETLEHLPEPDVALVEIKRVCRRTALVSVPREPIWRLLNVARGAYVTRLGNTPGHIQHWNLSGFLKLLHSHFPRVSAVATPLPWAMAVCEVDDRAH